MVRPRRDLRGERLRLLKAYPYRHEAVFERLVDELAAPERRRFDRERLVLAALVQAAELRALDDEARIEAQLPRVRALERGERAQAGEAAFAVLSRQPYHHLHADGQAVGFERFYVFEYFFGVGLAAACGEDGGVERRDAELDS